MGGTGSRPMRQACKRSRMQIARKPARYLTAATVLLLLCSVDGLLFDWRGTLAISEIITHSVMKQAETAETKVEIYDALWAGLLGVPAKKR